MGKPISDLPLDDRPYEKLELLGSENLSNSELLAIIIKTGKKNLSCVEIAQNILNGKKGYDSVTDIEYLASLSIEELIKYEGIGRVKSIQIKAVIELSKRISRNSLKQKNNKIKSPNDIFDLIYETYIDQKQEILKTVILNKSNKVLSIITNAIGNVDTVSSGVKEIFSEPIKQMASGIVLIHNHPSGNLTPSKNDISFTKNIKEYADLFNIKLLDHIIIHNDQYLSMVEKGYINT
ncbi:hypothetical protein D3C73_1085900 [compost metagenome]